MPEVDDSDRPPLPRDITSRVRSWVTSRVPSIGMSQPSHGEPAAAALAARRKLGKIASTTSAALSWASVGGIAAMAVLAATSSARAPSTQAATRIAALTPPATKPSAPSMQSPSSQAAIRVAAVRQSATPAAKSDAPSPVTGTPTPPPPAPAAASPAAPGDTPAAAPPEPPAPLTKWSEAETAAALRECLTLLAPIAAGLDVSEPMRAGDCGSPAPVLLRSVGASSRVEMKPAATLNCRMVARMHEWVETTLQPAARAELGSPVVRIIGSSGYSCRNRYGLANAPISEHAFANAIDIGGFVLADGRTVSVLGAWGPTARDTTRDKDAARLAKGTKPAVTELRTKVAAAAEAASHPPAHASAAERQPASPERPSVSQRIASASKQPLPGRSALGNPPPSPADAARAASEISGPAAPTAGNSSDEPSAATPGTNDTARPRNTAKSRDAAMKDAERAEKAAKDAAAKDAREKEREAEKAKLAEAQSRFLKRLHSGACRTFATVLGPEANEAHRNHFHFDLKERRTKVAVCQ